MTVTIYDVAREAGVSMATVSRVVNNNPNVKPKTRKKVFEAIELLGYRPNAVARGLASKKTTTIGVVIPDIATANCAEIVRGIEDIATMYHYNIILANSDKHKDKEMQVINTLLGKQVDGLLFLGESISHDHIAAFQSSPISVVLCGLIDEQHLLPSVDIDHEDASFTAVNFLIEKGHRRIGMVSGPLLDPTRGYARFKGYERALKQAGISYDDRIIRSGNYKYESGYAEMKHLLQEDSGLTAVFFSTDEMAIGGIHCIQDAGLDVPNDISVMGINNDRISSMVRPMLSTIAEPMYDIGAVAMRLLTKLIKKEPVTCPQVILPYEMILRNSVTELKK